MCKCVCIRICLLICVSVPNDDDNLYDRIKKSRENNNESYHDEYIMKITKKKKNFTCKILSIILIISKILIELSNY